MYLVPHLQTLITLPANFSTLCQRNNPLGLAPYIKKSSAFSLEGAVKICYSRRHELTLSTENHNPVGIYMLIPSL